MKHLMYGLMLIVCLCATQTTQAFTVGVQMLETEASTDSASIPAVVFYPAVAGIKKSTATFGPYVVEGVMKAPIADGSFPVVLISHGRGGSMFGHHDMAADLARQGYVVIMPNHMGDTWDTLKPGAVGSDILLGRARQASAALTALLTSPMFIGHIDESRIGAAGFSRGGYTALLLAGAIPNFQQAVDYCHAHPEDQAVCADPLDDALLAMSDVPGLRDERIKAIFLMAPLSLMFDEAGLKPINIPVSLYIAGMDRILIPRYNGLKIAKHIASVDQLRLIAGAGHFVFLAPCPAALMDDYAALCQDPPNIDREAIHRTVNQGALSFFNKHLQ